MFSINICKCTLDEDFEILAFTLLNTCSDFQEFLLIGNYNDFIEKHYGAVRKLYHCANDEFNFKCESTETRIREERDIKTNELYHTVYRGIQWVGLFHEQIGNNIHK